MSSKLLPRCTRARAIEKEISPHKWAVDSLAPLSPRNQISYEPRKGSAHAKQGNEQQTLMVPLPLGPSGLEIRQVRQAKGFVYLLQVRRQNFLFLFSYLHSDVEPK